MQFNSRLTIRLLLISGWLTIGIHNVGAQAPGSVDSGFAVGEGPDSGIRSVLAMPDGSTLIGGDFDYWGGEFVNSLVRLRPHGSRDVTFVAPRDPDFDAYGLWRQSDGKILVSGYFDLSGGRHHLVRLEANGDVDETFTSNFNSLVNDVLILPDSRLLVVGQFRKVGDMAAPGIARLHADGRIDESFQMPKANLSGFGGSAVQLKNGDYLVAGLTFQEGGEYLHGLLRFRPDGTVDRGYKLDGPEVSAGFFAKKLQVGPDGSVLLSSAFDVWRLTPEGFIDPGFNPDVFNNSDPEVLLIQPDGRLLGGDFNAGTVAGKMRRLIRTDADGALDANFVTDFTASPILGSPGVQFGGMHDTERMVVAGNFDRVDGQARNRVAQVHLRDRSAPASVRWNARQIAAVESGGAVTVTVLREGNVSEPASVAYGTVAITATAGVDFTAAQGVLRFAAHETHKRLEIAVHDGRDAEGDRQFAVVLSQPVGTLVGAIPSVQVTVLDDDASIQLGAISASSVEINSGVSLPVSRTGGLAVPAAMRWQVVGGSARPGVDFTPTNGVVVFGTGETRATIQLRLNDNAVADATRTVDLELVPGEFAAALGANVRASVTILDNDLPGFGGDGFDSTIVGFQSLADGNAVAHGNFTKVHGANHVGIVTLRPDGRVAAKPALTLESPTSIPQISALAATRQGGLLLCGNFTAINGAPAGQITRLDAAGQVDASFSLRSPPTYRAQALAELTDGGVLAAAADASFAASPTWHPDSQGGSFVKFLADGTRDPQFATSAIGSTRMTLIPLEGGAFLASGVRVYRDRISPTGFVGVGNPVERRDVARFRASGELDPGFEVKLQPGRTFGSAWPAVVALWQEAGGTLMLAGGFTNVNGHFQPGLTRLLPSGARDESFDATAGLGLDAIQVTAAARLPEGDILVGFVPQLSRTITLRRLKADGSRNLNVSDHYLGIGIGAGSPTVATGPILGVLRSGQVFVGFTGSQFDFRIRHRFAWLEADGSLGTDLPLALDHVISGADGTPRVVLRARSGGTFEIQRSENLADWSVEEAWFPAPGRHELPLQGGAVSGFLRAGWIGP